MPDLDSCRETTVGDLETLISRLETLDEADWGRDVPCQGWTVRHLAAHLTETLAFLEARLTEVSGAEPNASQAVTLEASTPVDHIVTALRQRQTSFVNRIGALTEADYEKPAADDSGMLPQSVHMYLELATFETALHRNDLEIGLGDRDARISDVGVAAIDAILGSNLVMFAGATGAAPDKTLSILFNGDAIGHTLTWDGTVWSGEPASFGKRVTISGEDSALVRFLCGRISADHTDLTIDGDIEIANRFKSFVPGP